MRTTPPPIPPDRPVLEYRSPATGPVPRFETWRLIKSSLLLGALSWLSACGVAAVGGWPAITLATLGFVAAGVAATRPLSRDAAASMLLAMFLNFLVLALWPLAVLLF